MHHIVLPLALLLAFLHIAYEYISYALAQPAPLLP
jgi:hypothetical protein